LTLIYQTARSRTTEHHRIDRFISLDPK